MSGITMMSASKGVTLSMTEAGVVSVASQTEGVLNGVIAGATGLLNGGATHAVGLASTLVDAGKILAGAAIANKTEITANWPLVGRPK